MTKRSFVLGFAIAAAALPRAAAAADATDPDAVVAEESGGHRIVLRLGGAGYGAYFPRNVGTYLGGGGGIVLRVTKGLEAEGSMYLVDSVEILQHQ